VRGWSFLSSDLVRVASGISSRILRPFPSFLPFPFLNRGRDRLFFKIPSPRGPKCFLVLLQGIFDVPLSACCFFLFNLTPVSPPFLRRPPSPCCSGFFSQARECSISKHLDASLSSIVDPSYLDGFFPRFYFRRRPISGVPLRLGASLRVHSRAFLLVAFL